jgi:hypothetical protein
MFQTLSGGGGVDLNGAASPLDFDLKTGVPPSDINVSCVKTGSPNSLGSSGVLFSAKQNAITGTLGACGPL